MQKEKFINPIPTEVVDQLRVERQSVHPAIHEYAVQLASDLNSEFVRLYGTYLHEKTITRNKNISGRIIISDHLGDEYNAWLGDTRGAGQRVSNVELDGFIFFENGIIHIMDPFVQWNNAATEITQTYEEAYGDFAISEFSGVLLSQSIIHEITHAYQPRKISTELSEMSARYAELELCNLLDLGFIRTDVDECLIEEFESVVEKFGREPVLRHTFGTLNNFPQSHEIDRYSKELLANLY